MSFFNQQVKEKKPSRELVKVGPGTYTPTLQSKKNYCYAPFGSMSKKQANAKYKGSILGPGAYDIRQQLIKPSISQFQNDKCIIIKVNDEGGSQFRSKVERFKTEFTDKQKNTPGPGYYNYHITHQQRNQRRTKSVGSAIHKMKQIYNKEYKQKREPTLISDPIIVPQKQEQIKKKVRGGVSWSLNKKDRFQQMYKKTQPIDEQQQDKYQYLEEIKKGRKKNKQNRQSSSFASKSVKSCFDNLIYKTNNPFKAEMRKILGYEDEDPGPGSYNIDKEKKKKFSKKFQFFGSTAQRFQTQKTTTDDIGPGYYADERKAQKQNKSSKKRRPKEYAVQSKKDDEEHLIGPGSYYSDNTIYPSSYNFNYCNGKGCFGSNIPRFPEKQDHVVPTQITSFLNEEKQLKRKRIDEEFQYRKQMHEYKNQVMFLSGSKRNAFELKEGPFGLYEVGVDDIGRRIKKQKQHAQQFDECNMYKPPFLSSVDRFKEGKIPEQTHKDCWCLVKDVEKKNIQHGSPVFESNAKKSVVFQQKYKAPPVGHYSKQSSLIKDSFNSKFIKANKNKTKKLHLWKAKQ